MTGREARNAKAALESVGILWDWKAETESKMKTPALGRGFCVLEEENRAYMAATKSGTIPAALSWSNLVIRAAMPVYMEAAR